MLTILILFHILWTFDNQSYKAEQLCYKSLTIQRLSLLSLKWAHRYTLVSVPWRASTDRVFSFHTLFCAFRYKILRRHQHTHKPTGCASLPWAYVLMLPRPQNPQVGPLGGLTREAGMKAAPSRKLALPWVSVNCTLQNTCPWGNQHSPVGSRRREDDVLSSVCRLLHSSVCYSLRCSALQMPLPHHQLWLKATASSSLGPNPGTSEVMGSLTNLNGFCMSFPRVGNLICSNWLWIPVTM